MLSSHKISIIADSIVDDVKIATFSASLDVVTDNLNLGIRHVDKEACKEYRDIVREDQKKFEDYAYSLQDMMKEIVPV